MAKTISLRALRWQHAVLLAICLVGIGLRLWGINFGLPYMYHPDEPNKIDLAQTILKTGDINPHYFLKPPFYIYVNALAYIPYLALQHLRGESMGIQNLEPPIMLTLGTGITPQPSTVILGRLLSLLFGSMCIPLVYLLVRGGFHDESTALIASSFVAVSPGLTPHSRFITPDSMVVFFCLLTVYASLAVYRRGRVLDYALAGVAGALASSAKYDAALVLIAPVVAHILANGFRGSLRNRRIFVSVLSALVTFVALNPVVLFSFSEFYEGASKEATHYATGHLGMEGDSLQWYVNYFWTTEGLIAVAGLLGMIVACLKRSKEGILLAVFPAVFFVFISSFAVRNDRTAIPITPFLYLFGVQWVMRLRETRSGASLYAKAWRAIVSAIITLMLVYAAVSMIQSTRGLLTIDGRETSRVWIQDHFAPGTKFVIESYSPYIDPRRYHVTGVGMLIDQDLSWYHAHETQYVVASEGMYGRFFEEPALYQAEIAAYDQIFSSFEFVRLFNDGMYEIRIYRVP